jgi:hypothetical protein
MTDPQRIWQASDFRRVTGRYELVGLNGSLLPAEMEDEAPEGGPEVRAFLVEGELHLALDQSYALTLTARYATPGGASYSKEVDSAGTWRFLASALDETSGEIALVSTNGGTSSAAVTRLSLVHRTRAPWGRRRGPDCTWVYIRREKGGRSAMPGMPRRYCALRPG